MLMGDGFKLNSLLFSFGEKTTKKTLAHLESRDNGGMLYYRADGTLDSGKGVVLSGIYVYEEGIDADTQLIHEDFGSGVDVDHIGIPNSTADDSYVYFTLEVKRIV
jgi:hypothetical protein